MSTSRTLHIRLDGEAEEHLVKVGPGQQLLVKVGDKLEVKKLHFSEDILVRHHKELVNKDKIIADKDCELKAKDEEIKRLLKYKNYVAAMNRLMPEDIRQELAPQQTDADSLTSFDRTCFNPSCRIALIKRELKGYISTHEWIQGYWVVVHKLFKELHWWKGKDKDFVHWANKLGYELTENYFKKVKHDTKDSLAQWYDTPSPDRYAKVAHELYDLFVGDPRSPKVATFESGHISRPDLSIRIKKSINTGIRNHRAAYVMVDTPGHADYAVHVGKKKKSFISPEALGIPIWRHQIIGTIDIVDSAKPGRRRCSPKPSALRHREVTYRF